MEKRKKVLSIFIRQKTMERELKKEIERLERFIDDLENEAIENDDKIEKLEDENEDLWTCLDRHQEEIQGLKFNLTSF
jgi:predicted  nucleic acid-binding Zn-ribbon protein